MSTITSANSIFTIIAEDVFLFPQVIEGYATEDAWKTAQYELARAMMGVDAKMSAGFVPAMKEMDIVLQADSTARKVMQAIAGAMESTREVVFIDATMVLPAVAEVWTFTRGVLTKASKLPDGKKTLEPVTWQITWEDIQPASL